MARCRKGNYFRTVPKLLIRIRWSLPDASAAYTTISPCSSIASADFQLTTRVLEAPHGSSMRYIGGRCRRLPVAVKTVQHRRQIAGQ